MPASADVIVHACRPLTDADLYVGACIPILQRNFKLLEADEYTYQFMENNRHIYRMADAEAAVQALRHSIAHGGLQGNADIDAGILQSERAVKLTVCVPAGACTEEALKARFEEEGASSGHLTIAQFQEMLLCLGMGITEHQIISIFRRLPKDELQRASVSSIMQAIGLC